MLRFGPEILALLGAVDAPQPDLLSPALVEDGGAVDDTDNLAPDQAAAVAGHSNRESARATEIFLIWFPFLLSCDRPGSHLCPGHAPWSRFGELAYFLRRDAPLPLREARLGRGRPF